MGSLGQEDPWRRKWQPTPVFLPGKPHGQRSLAGYSPWGYKSQTHDLVTKPPPPLIRLVRFSPNSQLLTDGWFWCLTILPSFHSLGDLYGEEGCSLAMWWVFFSSMILGLYTLSRYFLTGERYSASVERYPYTLDHFPSSKMPIQFLSTSPVSFISSRSLLLVLSQKNRKIRTHKVYFSTNEYLWEVSELSQLRDRKSVV